MVYPVKPPFGYYGAKVSAAPWLVSMFPEHDHYVEPFAGSLAVLLAKRPSTMETVNDLDGGLVTFWRVLRDRPRELAHVCQFTPHSRTEFEQASDPGWHAMAMSNMTFGDRWELEVARRVWVHLTQGRMGIRSATGWRYSTNPAHGKRLSDELDRMVARIVECAERIRHVQIENRPALEVVAAYGIHPRALLYLDPPYVAETRAGTGYLHEMPDEAQHREMAAALHECKAAVVVSGYRSPLYDELFAGWETAERPTQTANGGAGKATCEVVWSNRPLATTGHLF